MSLGCTPLTQVISVLTWDLKLNSHKMTQQLHKKGHRKFDGPKDSGCQQYSVIIIAGKNKSFKYKNFQKVYYY